MLNALNGIKDALELAESIINTVREPLIVLDSNLKVVTASQAFYQVFNVNPDETEGRFIYDLGNRQWDIPKLRILLEDILPHNSSFIDFEVEHDFPTLGKRSMLLNAHRIPRPPERPKVILLAIEDVTSRNQILAVQKGKAFAESIINTVREPLIVLDIDLRVVLANNSYYRSFQTRPQEVEKRLLSEIGAGQWNIPQLFNLLKDILSSNATVEDFEVERTFLNIGHKALMLNARLLIEKNDLKRFILLAFDDVTHRKQVEEDIKRISSVKTAFTSMVSHELRTPLSALKESVNIVFQEQLGSLNPEQKHFLGIAKRNLDRLVKITDDILNYQRLESGKLIFHKQKNDINSVVNEAIETVLGLLKNKGLELVTELTPNLPEITIDSDKIIQVLLNLLTNSIRATDKGWVKIKTCQKDNFIQVSVLDTGCGIKDEDISRLFQKYEQLERRPGGTGLGLAISREIITAHSGKIWAETSKEKETTIYFTLPIN